MATPGTVPLDVPVEKCREAICGALEWLRSQDPQIEAMADLASHYKAPYLYSVVGDRVRARKYADLIGTRYLQPDGDFRTHPDAKGWGHLPCSPANRYIYSNGWLIAGFQKMGCYGLAQRGLAFIRRFQSPQSGGFYSRFDVASGAVVPAFLDSSSTSSGGLALLACGRVEEAVRAGDFVLDLLDAQPQPERFYFSSWETGKGLMTDVFGDEDQNALRGRKQYCLSAEADPAHELVWLIGKPMKFLAKLYDATGERRYLGGAAALFDFFHRLPEGRWDNYANCKVMWGAAELFRHTGDLRYYETTLRILEWMCDSRRPWGGWVHWLWYNSDEEQPFAAALDLVQELSGEMSDTLFELCPSDATRA